MEVTVLVEPVPSGTGFRAATGGPLMLTADGASEEDAFQALYAKLSARLRTGTRLRIANISPEVVGLARQTGVPAAPTAAQPTAAQLQRAQEIIDAAVALGDHPLHAEFEAAIEEYRRRNNTVPEAD